MKYCINCKTYTVKKADTYYQCTKCNMKYSKASKDWIESLRQKNPTFPENTLMPLFIKITDANNCKKCNKRLDNDRKYEIFEVGTICESCLLSMRNEHAQDKNKWNFLNKI